MQQKYISSEHMEKVRNALRAKGRAEAEMQMLIVELEEAYGFSIALDNLDVTKGVITYANNTGEPVVEKRV